jgi:hypothetical protein
VDVWSAAELDDVERQWRERLAAYAVKMAHRTWDR